jgi:2',3'-cyclic-nucleotide 2'-phosphodiesterase (5'-nucleotidase family)
MRWLAALVGVIACTPTVSTPAAPPRVIATGARTITIIGTNDLHGALDRLPLLAGYIDNVRAARAADGGAVVLIDAGDLFQGTLESNLAEGADVIKAYNQLGYAASAIGNHEFDYGPVGAQATVRAPGEDPRGALKARVSEAKFPFLVTNIVDQATDHPLAWPNLAASTMITVAGTKLGILGASTEATPFTTMPANFLGLAMAKPTARYITDEAQALRARGAQIVVLTIHAGSECKNNDTPEDISTCDTKDEVFRVLDQVPKGLIDVVVAGHTHAAIAHRIDGAAVIESYSSGRAFGRVDIAMDGAKIAGIAIHKPEIMCPLDSEGNPSPLSECHPADYEGKKVVPDPVVQKIVDEALARTEKQRNERLGVNLSGPITKAYKAESIEGDWFGDLMLEARPEAQIALTNGGGLRADISSGELTYGKLFQAMPFDNRFALVTVLGKHVRRLVTSNLAASGGIYSWSGIAVKAICTNKALDIAITVAGKPLVDDAKYTVVTSDFLASGGDGVIGKLELPEGSVKITDVIMRDAMADVLRKKQGQTIEPEKIFNRAHPRLDLPSKRPVSCGAAVKESDP